jgi:hypothetical protein
MRHRPLRSITRGRQQIWDDDARRATQHTAILPEHAFTEEHLARHCAWLPVQLAHLPNTHSCARPDPPSSSRPRAPPHPNHPRPHLFVTEQTRSPSSNHKPRIRLVTGGPQLNVPGFGFGFGFTANCLRQLILFVPRRTMLIFGSQESSAQYPRQARALCSGFCHFLAR